MFRIALLATLLAVGSQQLDAADIGSAEEIAARVWETTGATLALLDDLYGDALRGRLTAARGEEFEARRLALADHVRERVGDGLGCVDLAAVARTQQTVFDRYDAIYAGAEERGALVFRDRRRAVRRRR